MEYIVFDNENKKLFLRDGFGHTHNRLTFSVITFTKTESAYVFTIEPNEELKYKIVYFPVQHTVLSII